MRKTAARHCPICEGINCEVLHTQKFVLPEGHPLIDGYDAVCCERCGFIYADTTATQEDYDVFYAKFSKYEDDKTSTGSGDTPWDARRLKATARQIAEVLSDKRMRILDIGCANGGLLKCLRKLGFDNLCGIDPSPVCVANTQSCGIEAHTGSLLQLSEKLGRFDFVILSHVLEHVHNLKTAMQTISSVLMRERERERERSAAFMLKSRMRHDMRTIFFHHSRTSILSTSIISRTSVWETWCNFPGFWLSNKEQN